MCDLVIDFVGYKPLLKAYVKVPFMVRKARRDFVRSPRKPTVLALSPTTSRPTSRVSSPPTVSLVMRSHKFYPEKRAGQGPKNVKTLLDKAFAISSHKLVEELEKQREEKMTE